MSNSPVDIEKVDYTHGEQCMRELYTERNVVVKSWADFLAPLKSVGYENNVKQVPNLFDSATDEAGDKYTTFDDCLAIKKIE